MHRVGAALAVASASTILFAACTSAKGITSLPADKKLSSLTPEERRQFCEDRFHYMSTRVSREDRKKIECSLAAGSVGRSSGTDLAKARSACQQMYKACTSVLDTTTQSSCETFPRDAEDCTATVGEADDCAEAQADALETVARKADDTCNELGKAPRKEEQPAKVQSTCGRVQRLCPKLFEEPSLGEAKP